MDLGLENNMSTKAMDHPQLFSYTENDGNGKSPKHPGDIRLTSHVAVQTEMEETKEDRQPCLVVQIQQIGRRDEVQNMPPVNVDVQHKWNRVEEMACMAVKIKQQNGEGRTIQSCIPVKIPEASQGRETQHQHGQWQPSKKYENVPPAMEDQLQNQCKEWENAAEAKQEQLEQAETFVITLYLQQNENYSDNRVNMLDHSGQDHTTVQLGVVKLKQGDALKISLEGKAAEKDWNGDGQYGKPTKTLGLHTWRMDERDLQDTTTNEQQEWENKGGSSTNQQQFCSDEAEQKFGEGNDLVHEKLILSKKSRKDAPNYFVAIPITNDQILDKIEDVQEVIFSKEPDLLRAFLPVQTMHITIFVVHLRTEEDVKRAVSALEHSKGEVEAVLQEKLFSMTFRGIGQFNNQVIFVKMSEDKQQMLNEIAEAVKSAFNKMNIDIMVNKIFKPHLTFLKLSKAPALRHKGFRTIHKDLYMEYQSSTFGTEILNRIDLCAMHKKKQDSGYYHCESSINICPSSSESGKNK